VNLKEEMMEEDLKTVLASEQAFGWRPSLPVV
jgi:hypothetical protein